jgi:hypothetical protein
MLNTDCLRVGETLPGVVKSAVQWGRYKDSHAAEIMNLLSGRTPLPVVALSTAGGNHSGNMAQTSADIDDELLLLDDLDPTAVCLPSGVATAAFPTPRLPNPSAAISPKLGGSSITITSHNSIEETQIQISRAIPDSSFPAGGLSSGIPTEEHNHHGCHLTAHANGGGEPNEPHHQTCLPPPHGGSMLELLPTLPAVPEWVRTLRCGPRQTHVYVDGIPFEASQGDVRQVQAQNP